MAPIVPAIACITFVFTFYMRSISAVRFLYRRIISASLFITFQSTETAASINLHICEVELLNLSDTFLYIPTVAHFLVIVDYQTVFPTHVSDSSSVHHKQFFTVHTAMVYVIQAC